MVQKLEGVLRESLKKYPEFLFHKVQVNTLAHCRTHCDFEVFTKHGDIFFIECKESKMNVKGSGSFPFSRLTQRDLLLKYENFSGFMYSYVCLLFRAKLLKNSKCYMIPIEKMIALEQNIGKKSFNVFDAEEHFSMYELEVDVGSTYKLQF